MRAKCFFRTRVSSSVLKPLNNQLPLLEQANTELYYSLINPGEHKHSPPTTTDFAGEYPAFGDIAGVSTPGVQWASLVLGTLYLGYIQSKAKLVWIWAPLKRETLQIQAHRTGSPFLSWAWFTWSQLIEADITSPLGLYLIFILTKRSRSTLDVSQNKTCANYLLDHTFTPAR